VNKDFVDALSQVAHERGVTSDELISNFEEALRLAYLRQKGFRQKEVEEEGKGPIIEVHLDPQEGSLEVLEIKRVVDTTQDPDKEIDLATAQKYDPEVAVGEEMEFPVDPEEFSRIAVQIAKQVLTQRLKEAERTRVHNEYKDKEGEVVTGSVTRVDNRGNVYVELGRGEALMPQKEQIPTERYHPGLRVRVYLKQVQRSAKGPSLVVSRANEELLRYLLSQHVPEIAEGIVEVKAIAREPGSRSKVAVMSHNPNVDPIGACIGQKGQRIQLVSAELGRERVDIIQWSPNPKEFIRNALSPATVGEIVTEAADTPDGKNRARVVVAKDQHSLAIGKAGQNVRLASKLTGFEIDFEEADEITDLDAAMLRAAEKEEGPKVSQDAKRRFESLFTEGE
jgi:N utilization substance protein A